MAETVVGALERLRSRRKRQTGVDTAARLFSERSYFDQSVNGAFGRVHTHAASLSD
jgi:hypothetical protein